MKGQFLFALIGSAIVGLLASSSATEARTPYSSSRAGASPGVRGRWATLNNCVLVANRANDGDSFHVSVDGEQYLFRLYFVDAPETDESFKDRVKAQAEYFGLTPDQTIAVGKVAENFTREKLSRPFIVRTCFQDALGRSRMERLYAIVQTTTGDLAEQLIENGLARIHGASANPAGLPPANAEWKKLRQLEIEARVEKVGGWGVTAGRMMARSIKATNRPAVDPFDAFFHPGQVRTGGAAAAPASSAWPFSTEGARGVASAWPFATPARPQVAATAAPVARLGSAGAKLDPNMATQNQLEQLPEIGPALAHRIIAARPFKTADELRNVRGIGDSRYAKIRPFFE